MKKIVIMLVVSTFVLTMISTVGAFGPGAGYGAGFGPYVAGQFNPKVQLTPEQLEKFNKFQTDVLPLRQKMLKLKTDLSILYSKANPDFKAIAEKQKEMVDVKIEIQKKAVEAGLPLPLGYGRGRGGCMGLGPAGGFKTGMGRF
ncbi:MAG: hypothetical protein SNJ53_08570 [Thermodesulfovibrionales bacterium]